MSKLFSQLSGGSSKDNEDLSVKSSPSAGDSGVLKTFVIISLVLSLAALAGALYLYQSLNAESRQRQALEATQVQFQEKASALELAAGDYKAQIKALSSEIKKYSEDKKNIEADLQKSKIEIAAFKNKINQLEERTAAVAQAGQAAASKLEASSPQSGASPAVSGAKKSQVMTVNRKFNFVVVNIGSKDNLRLGESLIVKKPAGAQAQLRVEKLYDTFAAATIIQESQNAPIQEGDLVERGA